MYSFHQKMRSSVPSTFFTKKNVACLVLFLSSLAAVSLLGGHNSEPRVRRRLQGGLTLSNQGGDRGLLSLVHLRDPKTVLKADRLVNSIEPDEIPHLLHIVTVWIGDDPYPSYWEIFTRISRDLAESQGFKVKVWDLPSLEALINDPNHQLEWMKPAWERVREAGEKHQGKGAARIADFARAVVVYIFGGVYLDLGKFDWALGLPITLCTFL